jgi:hypothetical protein
MTFHFQLLFLITSRRIASCVRLSETTDHSFHVICPDGCALQTDRLAAPGVGLDANCGAGTAFRGSFGGENLAWRRLIF